jgi:hypothetical protein
LLFGNTRRHIGFVSFNQGVTGSIPVRPTIRIQSFIFLDKFLQSRRQGSSTRTIEFYECCLKPFVLDYELSTDGINQFLRSLTCGNGKHGYYRAIRAFCNWLYRNRYVKSNPIENVDPPKQSTIKHLTSSVLSGTNILIQTHSINVNRSH